MKTSNDDVATDADVYEINLGQPYIGEDLDDFRVEVQGSVHTEMAVNADMFPLKVGRDLYNGHIRFTQNTVKLFVVKNGELHGDPEDVFGQRIDGLTAEYADIFVMYMVSVLRNL